MKKLLRITLVVLSVFAVFGITSCDDECINCAPSSYCGNFDKIKENAANSTCLAEDFITNFGCPNMFCSSRDPDISTGDRRACTVIDCQTLSCEDLRLSTFIPEESRYVTTTESGLIADISIDEETGLPIGMFIIDDLVGEFTCTILVP